MPIFHLDYDNGNDANDGSTWALAWKTLTYGATAARIAPGDTIRIAKSPDPTSLGQSASWTDLSRAVVLTSAVTKNVYLDGAWTASANVTCTASASRKEGANCSSIAVASAFTTGKAAYYPLGATEDFSGYQQISFWIRSSVALGTNDTLRVCLCSDATGDTIVNEFSVPAIPATNVWQVVTINNAVAMGAAIQSVALYCQTDPGTPTILIDNIIACKATSAADSLTLSSLISKNTGSEGWFGLKSINGTAIELDNDPASLANSGRGYSGTTESVALYKRETTKMTPGDYSDSDGQFIQDSGTAGSLITFEGGYNTATSIVDGETIFDRQNGRGYGIQIPSARSYIDLRGVSCVRCYIGLNMSYLTASTVSIPNANNNGVYGVYFGGNTTTGITIGNACNNGMLGVACSNLNGQNITVTNANSNNTYGLQISNVTRDTITVTNASNNGSNGVMFESNSHGNKVTVTNARDNVSSGMSLNICHDNVLAIGTATGSGYAINFTGSHHNVASIGSSSGFATSIFSSGTNYLRNSTLSTTDKVAISGNYANHTIWSTNENNDTDTHYGYTDGGLMASETTVRHTASGISWKLSPTSTHRSAAYPLSLKIATVAVSAATQITVQAWFRRSSTDLTARLICRGGQLTGVSDTSSVMTVGADTWEQLSVSVTPTQKGVLEFHAECWGGITHSCYVDDVTIT